RSRARRLSPGAGPPSDRSRPQAHRRSRPDPGGPGAGHQAMMRQIVRAAIVLTACAACSGSPSRADCDAIVNHLVDGFTAGKLAEGEGKAPKEYLQAVEKWRQLLKDDKDATHESLLQVCMGQMSSSVTGCVMAASTEAALARCFGG